MTFESVKNNFITIMKEKYAKFDGRARRAEYWQFVLVGCIFSIIPIVGWIASLAILLPMISAMIRRLHDLDKPGAFCLLCFVPLVNFYLIYLLAQEGTKGDNQFGPDPKAAE